MNDVGMSLLKGARQVLAYAKGKKLKVKVHKVIIPKEVDVNTSRKPVDNKIDIKPLNENDIEPIVAAFKELGWNKPSSQFYKYLSEQDNNERCIWVAWAEAEFLGYITLKWHSDYLPFKELGIPEINDLNVLPKYREKGIGTKLLDLAEEQASKKNEFLGIGVGLYSDYGNAQKIYVKRGYVPDGRGITYRNRFVTWNEAVTVDDDLVLWLIKCLKN